MFAKSITYTDYNGVERTEKFYFHLNQAEIIELNAEHSGGLEEILKTIAAEKDMKQLMAWFKKLILMSYGEKSLDGRQFKKSPELSKAFSETAAYPQFYMELLTNTDSASAFVNGIMPVEHKKEATQQYASLAAVN